MGFGNNYSEWDEEDWEDDEEDEEITNDEGNILTNKQKEELKRKKEEQIKQEQDEMDKRTSFFKKLGIDLSDTKDENKENVKDESVEIKTKKEKKKRKRVRFRNVCGNEEAKLDLQDLVDYLKNPEKYQKMGCKLPKGVLMAGPPGTGKTLLARALAGEAGVPFLATNGASFDEIFVGVGGMFGNNYSEWDEEDWEDEEDDTNNNINIIKEDSKEKEKEIENEEQKEMDKRT